jgi:hypothetical protein
VINLSELVRKPKAFFDNYVHSELKACDILCCNCHKKKTTNED